MSFYFSKSRFVATYERCNKYAWLDKHMPDQKTPVDEFTESLFDNGHKVGALAKQFFNIDVDVTVLKENGGQDNYAMLKETEKQINNGTRTIAEASFAFGGFFCSVDILVKNDDGSYNIYEVKSSKIDLKKYKQYGGVKKKYVLDAAYQQYVLQNCGINVNKVFVVLLAQDYVRGKTLELNKYFTCCDVTCYTNGLQTTVKDKLAEIEPIINSVTEPASVITKNCHHCDYFAYCTKHIPSPSPFDIYKLHFTNKCNLYNSGISFIDAPNHEKGIGKAARKQIEYYNRPNDTYVEKDKIKEFLASLKFPLYSLDFETYQAVVPEHEGMKPYEVVPFQYSLHIIKKPNGDYNEGSADIEETHFLDVTGKDSRRAIAESLVKDIPYGACVIAYNTEAVEKKIIERLAAQFPDLAGHLLSFEYRDPKPLFQNGHYYNTAMWNSFSIKSVLPALYPDEKDMDYRSLQGDIKSGKQAMTAIERSKDLSPEEVEQIKRDLIAYCALDTFAIVKILKKFYEVI